LKISCLPPSIKKGAVTVLVRRLCLDLFDLMPL
jgi:hypothetical protein